MIFTIFCRVTKQFYIQTDILSSRTSLAPGTSTWKLERPVLCYIFFTLLCLSPTALPASKNLSKTVCAASAINSCLLRGRRVRTLNGTLMKGKMSLKVHDKQRPKEFLFLFYFFLFPACSVPVTVFH